MIEIELSFLNLPRFLGQELLTPDPLGELSLTLVLGLRGTKRTFRVSHERNFRQTRKGSPEPRAPKRESDVCQILVSTVKGVGGEPLGPAFTLRKHLMSPKEMVRVQTLGQPERATLGLRKNSCHSPRILFVLGSELTPPHLTESFYPHSEGTVAIFQVKKLRLQKVTGPRLQGK